MSIVESEATTIKYLLQKGIEVDVKSFDKAEVYSSYSASITARNEVKAYIHKLGQQWAKMSKKEKEEKETQDQLLLVGDSIPTNFFVKNVKTVIIDNFEKHPSVFNSYVDYRMAFELQIPNQFLNSEGVIIMCRRRFSDFKNLRDKLMKHEFRIPELPKDLAYAFGGSNETFINQRMVELKQWLEQIVYKEQILGTPEF